MDDYRHSPRYYEFSQPEALEVLIQEKQNTISKETSIMSIVQSRLADARWNNDSLNSAQHEKEIQREQYRTKIKELVTEKDELKNGTKEHLDRIEADIRFHTLLIDGVKFDLDQIKWRRQQRREETKEIQYLKDRINKAQRELANLLEMKDQANFYKGKQILHF